MAGVSPSAVSNWRKRSPDFPPAVDETATGSLFDLDSIIAWFERNGRAFTRPETGWEKGLTSLLTTLWSDGMSASPYAVLLVLQVLYARHRAKTSENEGTVFARFWSSLLTTRGECGKAWADGLGSLAETDPLLADVLALPAGVPERSLRRVIDWVRNLDDSDVSLGAIASALLGEHAERIGLHSGQIATPESLARLMAQIVAPVTTHVFDPAAGAALALVDAWRLRIEPTRLYGQEVSELTWRLGFLHLSLHDADFQLERGDSLSDDRFRSLKARRIVLDAPFNAPVPLGAFAGDERWQYGTPQRTADWLWAQHLIHHLDEDGIGVMVVAASVLSRGGVDRETRTRIAAADVLDAVIELPAGMYAGFAGPVFLLVFDKQRRNRAGRMLFVNAGGLGRARRGRAHELTPEDQSRIVATITAWRAGSDLPDPSLATVAPVSAVIAKETDLSPKRHVRLRVRETEIDGEPIADRLARLTLELDQRLPQTSEALHEISSVLTASNRSEHTAWPQVRLGEVLDGAPVAGSRQSADDDGPEVPFVSTGHVTGGSGRLSEPPNSTTSGRTKGRLVRRGDLLLASRGIDASDRVGCATVDFEQPAAYSESLLRLRVDRSRVDPDFLRYFLTSRQGRRALAAASTGSTISNLRSEAVMDIEIPLPPRATQRAVAERLLRLEDSLRHVESALATGRDAFDTLREGTAAGLYE